MILHQAKRPAGSTRTQARPEAEGDSSALPPGGMATAIDSIAGRTSGRPAAHALLGPVTGLLRTASEPPPDMAGCSGLGRGLSAVLADERRQWWPQTATRPRFDHRGGEATGRWPVPTSDEPRLGRQVLGSGPESPRLAREYTRTTLSAWQLGHMCDEVLLIVSELVTNALCHGLEGVPLTAQQSPIQLVLLGHRRRLVTVVTDPGDSVPARSDRGPAAENGRGLCVIDGISSAWGWAPLATGGKAVWAALEITPITGALPRSGR